MITETHLPGTIREKGFRGRPSDFDDEFKYDDGMYGGKYIPVKDLEAHTAEIMKRVEDQSDIVKSSNQAVEEYRRLFEQNVAARKEFRWDKQDELQQKREGKILHMNQFLTLLKQCGLNCWYTQKGGMAKTLGLYVSHTGLLPACSHERAEPHYVGFVQVPFMQEYEELYFDQYNVPLGSKRRGWRTILLRLVEQYVVSESKLHEVFGEPASGPVSRRYRAYLQYLRGRPLPLNTIAV